MPQIIVDTDLDEETFISTKKKRTHIIPPFQCIGSEGMSKFNIQGLDLPPILINISGPAAKYFWQMVMDRDRTTNIVVIRGKDLSKYEKNKLSRIYLELHKADLVRRVKREYYMINPKAVLTKFENFEGCWNRWQMHP